MLPDAPRGRPSAARPPTVRGVAEGTDPIQKALEQFASSVETKFKANAKGEAEEQLRAPFETLIQAVGAELDIEVVSKGESLLAHGQGKPDYATVADGALVGYSELKAPGAGVAPSRFKGHDRDQWKRFSSLPNLLYCDGNNFALYRTGERHGQIVRLTGDVRDAGSAAVDAKVAAGFRTLLADFLGWTPIVPTGAEQLAEVLAPLCRVVRDAVADAVADEDSPLAALKRDWQDLLFPEADDAQFADAYAQTATYALLLARAEGAAEVGSASAATTLQAEHSLLARTLEVLTEPTVRAQMGSILELLERTIAAVDPATLTGADPDPWLYFYEHFLSEYDPDLRRDTGVYYTPVQVVRVQVRLADELLRTKLGRNQGFADDEVLTLDPGLGTGTYLLGVLDHALARVEQEQGQGAVPGRATVMAETLHGFEIMVGPYAVSQLRLTRELKSRQATLGPDGINVFLTDTLEHPSADAPQSPLFYRPIAKEHERAQKVKDKTPILVCIGNPPYDRHDSESPLGGWVRHGAEGDDPLLDDFLGPARAAGHGIHLKNLYNLYVYFWRWALWKVFEHDVAPGQGVVSFISASSYLLGSAFVGMRERIRRECDEVWVIDLGGEGRGTRKEENVFAIQTPVAIAVATRYGEPDRDTPAEVHYARIRGNRETKLAALDNVERLADLDWESCPDGWQDPFRPSGAGVYFGWPRLTEIFPWQHSGVQVKRAWPIGPTVGTLTRRWTALLAGARARLFRETPSRKVAGQYLSTPPGLVTGEPLARLSDAAPPPATVGFAYRSFDRQLLLGDVRLLDRPRPSLWRSHSGSQVYLTTLLTHPLGAGPAVTASAEVPDLHHFRGSFGGKDVLPLYRDAEAADPNVRPGLLDQLSAEYGVPVTPEALLAYVAGVLAHPAYTQTLEPELETPGPRVPLTRDSELFAGAAELGRRVLWLQTYAARYSDPAAARPDKVPPGVARATVAVSQEPERYPAEYFYDETDQELRVGDGVFAPVPPEVAKYEVSGLVVLDSWLGYRMRERAGRTTELDEIQPERWTADLTDQLLELLWVLEGLVALEAEQADALARVVAGPLIGEGELPALAEDDPVRSEPKVEPQTRLLP